MQKLLRRLPTPLLIGFIFIALTFGYYNSYRKGNPGTKGTVTIGYVNWQEDVAVTYLWKELLEEKGYKIELKNLDVAPLFIGLSRGDLDLFLDGWLPITQKAYWEKHKNNLEDYGNWYQGEAKVGLVVPKYAGVNSISELNTKSNKFGGQIIGIDPGAEIMNTTEKVIRDYNLDFKLIQGSEAAMLAAVDKAYRENKWIVFIGWSPHWMFSKYELKYLSDEKNNFGESEGLHVLANNLFSRKHPEVADMLKKFKMNDQQIGELENLIQQGMQPQEAAEKWIKENKSVVDNWIN